MYHDSQGMKVYRPWCEVHRPIRGQSLGEVTPRPRPYGALNQAWTDKEKCPFCHRKREPRQPGGILRPTCREHRGHTAAGKTRKQGRPTAVRPEPPQTGTTPRVRVRTAVRSAKPVKPANPREVTFRDAGKSLTVLLPREDLRRLQILHAADVGHYPAATDTQLTKKYPTAMIAVLWSRWNTLQEVS